MVEARGLAPLYRRVATKSVVAPVASYGYGGVVADVGTGVGAGIIAILILIALGVIF